MVLPFNVQLRCQLPNFRRPATWCWRRDGAGGNSGHSSKPHLHINAQEPGTVDVPFSYAPISI
jgi:hypothetical protein